MINARTRRHHDGRSVRFFFVSFVYSVVLYPYVYGKPPISLTASERNLLIQRRFPLAAWAARFGFHQIAENSQSL